MTLKSIIDSEKSNMLEKYHIFLFLLTKLIMIWNIHLDVIINMITFKLYSLFYLPWLAKSCIYGGRILKSNETASKFSVFTCTSRLLKVIIWVFWIQCSHSWDWILLGYLKYEVSIDALMHSRTSGSQSRSSCSSCDICVCACVIHKHTHTHAYMFTIA